MTFATAVVVDQWALFRLGIEQILVELDIRVLASTGRAGEANSVARDEGVDLYIVGKVSDLKLPRVLREIKRVEKPPSVVVLMDRAEKDDVALLLSLGADALILRSTTPEDFEDTLLRLGEGERVVAPSVASGSIGLIGPSVHLEEGEASARSGLSSKELEVLAALAEGMTYQQIAKTLIIGIATVKTHLVHIYAKLEVSNREQAVARALSMGLLS